MRLSELSSNTIRKKQKSPTCSKTRGNNKLHENPRSNPKSSNTQRKVRARLNKRAQTSSSSSGTEFEHRLENRGQGRFFENPEDISNCLKTQWEVRAVRNPWTNSNYADELNESARNRCRSPRTRSMKCVGVRPKSEACSMTEMANSG